MSDTPDTLHRLHDEIADLKRKLEFKEMVEEQLQRTEEALYRSERRFHFLADAAIDAIFVFKDGTCRDANQEAADMFGFGDPADFLGMSELDIIAPESRDAVEEYIRDTETRKYCEALGLRRDGTTFPLEIKSRETSWADGETVKVNAIRDISARRAVERQLQQSQKMEAIGRLAGGVAHDVNNVLGVILNSANMLELETGLSEESRDDLSNIVEACRRGRDLTRNLLGFARKGRYVRTDISLNRVVEGAAALLSRTMSKDIHTEFDLQPSLRHVEGDPGQLEHALMNIFLNAADAMESGGIIRITSRDISIPSTDEPASLKLAPGAYIRLDVADTGKGMDEATLQRAFEPFFTTKPEGKGTGLGLSMVYGTVVNHRGDVVIHSAPQQGTCVSLYLPSVERRTSTAPVRPPWTHLVADSPAWILLVDDEPMVLRSSSRILEAWATGCWPRPMARRPCVCSRNTRAPSTSCCWT